jgi:hypothetical protein
MATAPSAIPPWEARPHVPNPFISYNFAKLNFYRPEGAKGKQGQLLLTLDAVDKIPGTEIFGLDYDTAIEANAIICGNRFDGRLARMMPDGSCDITLVVKPSHGILLPDNYYFCIPEQPQSPQLQIDNEQVPGVWDYPVVKEFRDWIFPKPIPSRWANCQYKYLAPTPGTTCCLTFNTYSTDEAHLIPDSEICWFSENEMTAHGGGIRSEQNTMTLRTDIHRCLDNARFAFIPKGNDNTVICHFLVARNKTGSSELFHNYHDVPISIIDKAPQFLFARFAYSIFKLPSTVIFIKGGSKEYKILVKGEEKIMTASQMNPRWGPFFSARYSNSSKRARTTAPDKSAEDSGDDRSDGDKDSWLPTAMNPTELQERHRQLDDWLVTLPEQDDDVEIPPQPGPSRLSPTLQLEPDAAVTETVQTPILGSIGNIQLEPASKGHQPQQRRSRETQKENEIDDGWEFTII